jgi:hypothetical protein
MSTLQTRIPAFLWNALQDVFYEQDVAFLKALAPHVGVSLPELKRSILGARGALTTIHVGNTDAWWETQLCPLMCRDEAGIWRQCGHYREGTGFCRTHHNFWQPSATLKHRDDPWFQKVVRRVPWRYEDAVVWVSPAGDAIYEDGSALEGVLICPQSGIARPADWSSTTAEEEAHT